MDIDLWEKIVSQFDELNLLVLCGCYTRIGGDDKCF